MNANNNKQQRQLDPNKKKTIDTETVYGPPYEVTNYYIFTTNPN